MEKEVNFTEVQEHGYTNLKVQTLWVHLLDEL